jgi:predicted dienelactone hydrolase
MNSRPVWAIPLILLAAVLVSRSQIGRPPDAQSAEQKLAAEQSKEEALAAKNPPLPRPATACGSQLNLGFHIQTFPGGLRAAVWYPTTAAESKYEYPTAWLSTAVAKDAPVADCGHPYPLIVYSHGLSGCGTIATFYTEAQARAGYVVVAPDHRDSICKVDKPYYGSFPVTPVSLFKPQDWSPSTYKDRADDIRRVLDELPKDPMFARHVDGNHIGATGHSLGGYTVMGLVGGWPSWRDPRIKAAVLMSPYTLPFQVHKTIRDVHIPLMYQGGTLDIGITPFIRNPGGAYEVSNPPKFFVDIRFANHLDWTSFHCSRLGALPACENTPMARQIDNYAIAFFNRYLKENPEPMLDRPDPALAEFRFDDPSHETQSRHSSGSSAANN